MTAPRLLSIAALLACATLACSPGDRMNAMDSGFDDVEGDDDTDPVDDTSDSDADTDTAPEEDPAFWSVDGDLNVTSSLPDTATSRIRIGFWTEDTRLLCETEATIAAVTALAAPDDVPVFGWWSLGLAEGGTPCSWSVPTTLSLGIGAMDPRLGPALDANGLGDREANLYALYASPVLSDTVYVFGTAGTAEQYAGTATPVAAAPLPDGAYELRTLHLLPIVE